MSNKNHITDDELVLDIDIDGKAYVLFYTDRLEKVPRLYLCIMERVLQDKQDEDIWYEGLPVAEIVFTECDGHYHVEGCWTITEDKDNPTEKDTDNRFLSNRFIKEHRADIEEAISKYMFESNNSVMN